MYQTSTFKYRCPKFQAKNIEIFNVYLLYDKFNSVPKRKGFWEKSVESKYMGEVWCWLKQSVEFLFNQFVFIFTYLQNK